MGSNLYLGDCLEILKSIPDKSIDLVLTDPPYGTTACKWDNVIPFEPMWNELKRIRKDNAAIVLFSKNPFTSLLNTSNLIEFKQEVIWVKDNHDNPLMAKKKFLNIIENISIFYASQPTYNPQGLKEFNKIQKQGRGKSLSQKNERPSQYFQKFTNYPKCLLKFKRDKPQIHPTQKPVALLEYLIKTYTLENETVLDFTMGSGSTGVACKNLNRNFIGIEKDEKYFEIAKQRIYGNQDNS